jgi:hypothetical protein
MAISPFIFSSENLPRLKAKQLFKAFPFLKLSAAQEATARALGYSTWYECSNRGTSGKTSLSDQEAGLSVRVGRYYHQAGVLMGLGIAPSEADLWVRAWGLTGQPTLAPEEGVPLYYRWNETLERLERGEISEEQAIEQWDDAYSKYPDIDRPERVCPGVILGPCGRYPHYAVDPSINARIPIYLRGPSSLYHYEDDGDVLAMTVAGFPKEEGHAERIFPRLNRIQYEWHHGTKHPESKKLYCPQLEAAALALPDSIVVISQRAMPGKEDRLDLDQYAVACLRGRDFAAFLSAKGVIDPTKVIWYRSVDGRSLRSNLVWNMQLNNDGWNRGAEMELPVFVDADKHQPSLPLYSYPFMTAPMHSDEYSIGMERACLLPLDEDYDDGSSGDSDPNRPIPTLDEYLLANVR